jgi:uncharacterized damage-inducible protein DinB
MSIAEILLPEFEQEMTTTRRVLARVPSEKGEWKPHPKSFTIGHLAQLVAGMPSWLKTMLKDTELDLAKQSGYSYEKTEALVQKFDKGVGEGREALKTAKDADFTVPWSLKHGDRILFTLKRAEVVRSHINHVIHHRGQLTVYLRLLDVPVPSIYGPTADERW